MRSQVTRIAIVVLALGLARYACADLIPTPDFSDHAIPTSAVPAAHSAAWVIVDIVGSAGRPFPVDVLRARVPFAQRTC